LRIILPTAVDPVTLQPDASRSAINAFISSVEPLFTALFTFEAVMKIIAMGLVVDRGSYLRDGLNILDAVVVISALLGAIPGVPNISALRAVRVLRPLRTLSRAEHAHHGRLPAGAACFEGFLYLPVL